MKVLSLFDGISCGRQALHNIGITPAMYMASEIDKHAIKVSKDNWGNISHIGDVTKISYPGEFDLMIGGSPCQSLSSLGDGSGLNGKSGLFYHWLRIRDEVNPKYWLLENVKPKKREWSDKISELVGVDPIEINSNYFLPQSRTRLYWTNIKVDKPEIQNTETLGTLLCEYGTKYLQTNAWNKWWSVAKYKQLSKRYSSLDEYEAICLTARMYASWNGNFITTPYGIRRLSPKECCRLQGLPDNYTKSISEAQSYKAIGNSWTVPVIEHILKNLLNPADNGVK